MMRLGSSRGWSILGYITALAGLSACGISEDELAEMKSELVVSVTAKAETTPVPHSGDAADDPAVWLHPTDLSQSTIIGTDKQGGIAVYDLSGKQLSYRGDGDINNVDLRYGFPLGNAQVALVGGTNRSTNKLTFWKVNSDRTLSRVGDLSVGSGIGDVYGFALHKTSSGTFYAFVVDKDSGRVEQYRLDGSSGQVQGTRVRSFDNGGISEGMVVDDAAGFLFVSEETVGVWRYGADPSAGSSRTKVLSAGANGTSPDFEGLAIYQRPDGSGYLLLSSQGNSTYAVMDRKPPHAYLGSFEIGSGSVDSVFDTDGIDVTNVNLGPAFPEGLFIAQDGANSGGNQNFKLVPWGSIARAFSPDLAIDTSFDPRGGSECNGGSCQVKLTRTLVAANATWRYLDNGTDAGTDWREYCFDDGAWRSGPAQLGFGEGDEATLVDGGPSTQRFVTTYFRNTFQVTDASAVESLTLRIARDDGAVVYLNGIEAFRTNMPTGKVTYTTLASSAHDDDSFKVTQIPTMLLKDGTNLLAIEVHQANRTSSDLSFAAELFGTGTGGF